MQDYRKNADQLKSIIDRYMAAQDYYKAFTLALDYYELTKPFIDSFKGEEFSDVLYNIFTLICDENDKDHAIALATILVDEYISKKRYIKILKLNNYFLCTFMEITKTTSNFLIMKEAIKAALHIVEDIGDKLPPDEVATLVCEAITYLPLCYTDAEFMLSTIHRITSCYKSESEPRLNIIAQFLPALKQVFDNQSEWLKSLIGKGNLSIDGITAHIETHKEYMGMLFGEDTPVLL